MQKGTSQSNQSKAIKTAIDNLSKKKNIISEEAVRAKEELDAQKKVPKQLAIVDEFNQSVKVLTAIFHQSKFDELVILISSPIKVLLLNFFIGVLRGMGFVLGFLFFVLIVAVFFKDMINAETLALVQAIFHP